MTGALFINCLPQDQPHFEPLRLRLQQAGIPYYLPPPVTSPQIQQEVVETIRQTAVSGGGMVCLLSRAALADPTYISNIQWMCENARSRKALIFFPLERLDDTRPIRLFAPQAIQVKAGRRPEADLRRLTRAIHAVSNPRPASLFGFLSTQFSPRLLRSLLIATLVIGIGGAAVYTSMNTIPTGPVPPTPTPVVMLAPFSGQSVPAGLAVDPGEPPDLAPTSVPAEEAPFSFRPSVILDRQTFDNADFNSHYNHQDWVIANNSVAGLERMYVRQRDGVLHLQAPPRPERQVSAGIDGTYLFNLQTLSYLGIRFRLDPYPGTIRDGTSLDGMIDFQTLDSPQMYLVRWNMSQELYEPVSIPLETRWHALELRRLPTLDQADIYLDGKKIDTMVFDQGRAVRWLRMNINLFIANTDQWTGMQIDEVVYGADEPIPSRLEVSGAPYHLTPDTVLLHQDFNAPLSVDNIQGSAEFVGHVPGAVSLQIPAGEGSNKTALFFLTRPIDEANYYAIRFRLPDQEGNPFNAWTNFQIRLVNNNTLDLKDGFDVSFGTFPHSSTFNVGFGIMMGLPHYPFGQYMGQPAWHTFEMVIQPPANAGELALGWFWADGGLLGRVLMRGDASRLLDHNAEYILNVILTSDGDRLEPLSAEVDDLIIGVIATGNQPE